MIRFLDNILTGLAQWWFNYSTISAPSNDLSFSYIVKYSGGSRRSDYLPMLIALHGDGDTVDNFYENALNQFNVPARIILVKGPIPHECGYVWPYSIAQFEKYGAAFSEIAGVLANEYSTASKPILWRRHSRCPHDLRQIQDTQRRRSRLLYRRLARVRAGHKPARPNLKNY